LRNTIIALVALLVIGGGVFFALNRDSGMSDAELVAALSARAAQINAADGERFDDFSQLVSAIAVERQITIRAETFLEFAALPDGYLDNRRLQAARILCMDAESRAMMRAGATHVFNWWSADDQNIGMVTLRGDATCAENNF
jgi:hypothetical protein